MPDTVLDAEYFKGILSMSVITLYVNENDIVQTQPHAEMNDVFPGTTTPTGEKTIYEPMITTDKLTIAFITASGKEVNDDSIAEARVITTNVITAIRQCLAEDIAEKINPVS